MLDGNDHPCQGDGVARRRLRRLSSVQVRNGAVVSLYLDLDPGLAGLFEPGHGTGRRQGVGGQVQAQAVRLGTGEPRLEAKPTRSLPRLARRLESNFRKSGNRFSVRKCDQV